MDPVLVTVGPKGRIVIPAALRQALGITEGSQLVAYEEAGAVVLTTRAALKARLRARFAHLQASLAEELIAERRAEAAGEAPGR